MRSYIKTYFIVGTGGFIGSILRFTVGKTLIISQFERFPLKTFFVNITGAFLMSFIIGCIKSKTKANKILQLGIGTGFLGAYTTFSTMCRDIVQLFNISFLPTGIIYILISVIVGLAFSYAGYSLGRKIISIAKKYYLQTETKGKL